MIEPVHGHGDELCGGMGEAVHLSSLASLYLASNVLGHVRPPEMVYDKAYRGLDTRIRESMKFYSSGSAERLWDQWGSRARQLTEDYLGGELSLWVTSLGGSLSRAAGGEGR